MKRQWETEELVESWTLHTEDLMLPGNKTGATWLGFAVLLKFFQREARFPSSGCLTRLIRSAAHTFEQQLCETTLARLPEEVFAFRHLLGFRLLPRLKDISNQKLYRSEASSPTTPASAHAPINRDLIKNQYH